MGLDLVPLGRPQPGHEEEWERLMAPLYKESEVSEAERERRLEISLLPYALVGAPEVGRSAEADAWIMARKPADSERNDADFLAAFKGYCVLALVEDCDGVPRYSNGSFDYDGIDETSFRGAFLKDCEGLMGSELLEKAWTTIMPPQEAVAYGGTLMDIAARAERGEIAPAPPERKRGLFQRLGLARAKPLAEEVPLEDQLDILRAAGRWYSYWGERGHPIWAYY